MPPTGSPASRSCHVAAGQFFTGPHRCPKLHDLLAEGVACVHNLGQGVVESNLEFDAPSLNPESSTAPEELTRCEVIDSSSRVFLNLAQGAF